MVFVFVLSDKVPLTLATQMKAAARKHRGSNQSPSSPSLPVFPAGMSRHLGDPVAHAASQALLSSKEPVSQRKLV